MLARYSKPLMATVLIALLSCSAAFSQTVIIEPRPPRRPPMPPIPPRGQYLEVTKHMVSVSIVDGVAVTSLDQTFRNPHKFRVEGTYIFPFDDDVALGQFSMFIDGKEVSGKLLAADEARAVYEGIVAKMRDPALLEYVGKKMFRASIFPIEAESDVRVKLSFTQMLSGEDGLVRYRYPLGSRKYQTKPIGTASVVVNIESKTPIKSVFSPSHKIGVHQSGDHKATASYEGKNVLPDKDFELYYSLSDKQFGLTMLAYRDGQSKEDGFFLARISPPTENATSEVLPKDICFVLDTSGSMAGEKWEQAQRAVEFCLSNLNKEDRFNIIPFSHEALRFSDTLMSAGKDNVNRAREFVKDLKAIGGTNINDALLSALDCAPEGAADRPYMIVFMTDGEATIGVTDKDQILENVAKKNTDGVRMFVFGVGYQVNTLLLDALATQSRGTREYVEPGEDLELKLSSFYSKIAKPVLADLALKFHGLRVYDVYPQVLSDLFSGSELVVAGRYDGSGGHAIELTGKQRGVDKSFTYEFRFPEDSKTHDFLPRLWASRKVGFLMDEIRLHGEKKELKDTIVQLATSYGIITPYTSYLVTEPNQASDGMIQRAIRRAASPSDSAAAGGGGRSRGGRSYKKSGSAVQSSGKGAVRDSQEANALQQMEVDSYDAGGVSAVPEEEKGESKPLVVRVKGRTFYYVDGKYIDSTFDEKNETRKVTLFSKEYFDLVRKHADLGKCFAIGERVIVVVGDVSYETVPADDGD